MWPWPGRPKRDIPQVNYTESSSEEDYEEGLNFNSPLQSPRRPHQSASASPRALLQPDPLPVDEVLQQVNDKLENLKDTSDSEEVLEGHIQASADNSVAEMPNQAVVNFEDENGDDTAGALREGIQAVAKINWDDNDLKFVFKKLEISIAAAGAKKQYTKFQIVCTILPKHIEDEVKSLLEMQESEFTENNSYKQLKSEIMRIFGPKPSAAIDRALTRVMTGKPSVLARALVGDVNKKLNCDSCLAVVLSLWKRQLPSAVRAGIAHMDFTKENFNAITQLADDIFESQPNSASVASIRTEVVNSAPQSLDVTQPGLAYPVPEVNAISRGRGGRNRGRGRGGRNRGQSNQAGQPGGSTPSSRHKGSKHPDLPAGEWLGCSMHFKHGRGAYFCSEPSTCPWKNVFTAKPAK